MSMSDENEERGGLVLRERAPLYGHFTLLVSDSFTFAVTESKAGIRLDFRRSTLRERVEVWRRKWGL